MPLEKLNKDKILSYIPIQYQPAKLEVFDTIDSTNTYLLNQARMGRQSGWCCFAEQQTAGRGRLGRVWDSPPSGNLYFSLLWQFEEVEQLSGISIVIAVVLTYVLKKYGINERIQLKWPNDVLFDGRKLAGILLETIAGKDAVIGIGINWTTPSNYYAIGLTDIAHSLSRNKFAADLITELFRCLAIFGKSGVNSFISDWRKYDFLLKKPICLILPDKEITGIMQGINEQGELVLETEQGIRTFCYGEVSVKKEYLDYVPAER